MAHPGGPPFEGASAEHLPCILIPAPEANHFTITNQLRDQDGMLTRYLPLLLPER